MFIPEFWCGVAATLLAEVLMVLAAAGISYANKTDKKDGDGR